MKKNLTHKELGKYSAMAAAFMSTATTADAAVVYTDVDPDATVVTFDPVFPIDFDGDGNVDVNMRAATWLGSGYIEVQENGNAVMGSAGVYIYPYNLAMNDPVGPAGNFYTSGIMLLNTGSFAGNFLAPNNQGYFGVRFDIGGATHYGWVEVDVVSAGQVDILGFAYEDTPDTEILAGDTGGGGGPVGPGGAAIPTMSEWGLITFALSMMTFGMLAIGRSKRVLADGTTVDAGVAYEFRNPPFSAKHFKKAAGLTLGLIALATTGTLWAYGTIAMVDVLGFSVAAPIFTYLTHLMMRHNEEWQKNK